MSNTKKREILRKVITASMCAAMLPIIGAVDSSNTADASSNTTGDSYSSTHDYSLSKGAFVRMGNPFVQAPFIRMGNPFIRFLGG